MASVPLKKGGFTVVDEADADRVLTHNWYEVRRGHKGRTTSRYAETMVGGRAVLLHRFLFGEEANGLTVDHINGDGLDNRRENLRLCHQRDNARNRRSATWPKGVKWRKDIGKFRARIMVNRREITLGVFTTQEEAVAAYDRAAAEHFGPFARLNGPAPKRQRRAAA